MVATHLIASQIACLASRVMHSHDFDACVVRNCMFQHICRLDLHVRRAASLQRLRCVVKPCERPLGPTPIRRICFVHLHARRSASPRRFRCAVTPRERRSGPSAAIHSGSFSDSRVGATSSQMRIVVRPAIGFCRLKFSCTVMLQERHLDPSAAIHRGRFSRSRLPHGRGCAQGSHC